ncbi:MAG: saccharopine dehydrogenase NADP-binding domain-containing protein [archaeon]|nr:saccharopine dehydrogenase NADP-binding domain-containing protein [archaeon]
MTKPNLLVIGASGGVANAFLHSLVHHRDLFNKLILVDKNKQVLSDQYINHKELRYTFVKKEIKLPEKEKEYLNLLKKYKISIVLDITDMNTIPIIEATNKARVSYINTAMNDTKMNVTELIFNVLKRKNKLNKAPHILCTGMNPGVVNMWVQHGIEKFGVPKEIVHFEYDTSVICSGWKPMMTWSRQEYLVECVRDPSGKMLGRDQVKPLYPNALENRVNMESFLKPFLKLEKYPEGFTVLHEENVTLAQKYNIPSQFIYAVNIKTMNRLINLYENKQKIGLKDLVLSDNRQEILEGSDSIGVYLEYSNRRIYYFNTIPNIGIIGTNATYTQVAIGIFAAIFTILFDKVKGGIHFVEDLSNTHYKYYLFDNMRVQEFIFKKKGIRSKQLVLEKYTPEIKIKRKHHLKHIFV